MPTRKSSSIVNSWNTSAVQAFVCFSPSARKETAAKGGKVIVEHINDDIKKVFTMTGFIKLFDVR